jgi:hypothetical protein
LIEVGEEGGWALSLQDELGCEEIRADFFSINEKRKVKKEKSIIARIIRKYFQLRSQVRARMDHVPTGPLENRASCVALKELSSICELAMGCSSEATVEDRRLNHVVVVVVHGDKNIFRRNKFGGGGRGGF